LSLRLAAGVILLTAGAAWALVLYGQQRSLDATFRSITAATTDIADLSQQACVSQGLSPEVKTCVFGPADAPRAIVLFGDSHAVQWFNPMRTAAGMQAWRLVTVLKSGCAASDINPHALATPADVCREWRSRAVDTIVTLHPAAGVMASYTGATLRGFRSEDPLSTDELRLGTRRTLQKLSGAGFPIVVLRDSPLPPSDIPACVARRALRQPDGGAGCDFAASTALNEPAFAAERAAGEGLPGVYYLSLSDLICPGSSCPATQHGLLVYRDDNHLTGAFAESLAPILRTRLFQLLRDTQ
jgi:hypothetical protein